MDERCYYNRLTPIPDSVWVKFGFWKIKHCLLKISILCLNKCNNLLLIDGGYYIAVTFSF